MLPIPVFARSINDNIIGRLSVIVPGIIKSLPEPPFFLQKQVAEKVLAKLLADPVESGDFEFLEGRWLKICVDDMGLEFYLSYQNNKLVLGKNIITPDVSFGGNADEFLLLASRKEDPDTLFFQRRLIIEGDTELGLYIKNSIDSIDFDAWPNWLVKLLDKVSSIIITLQTKNNFEHQ